MSPECYRFDKLTIDLEAYHLMRPDGTVIDLTYQEQQLLRVLIEARGRALSVAELGRLALGWPGTYASPSWAGLAITPRPAACATACAGCVPS